MRPALAVRRIEPAQPSNDVSSPNPAGISPAQINLVRVTFQILAAERDRLTEMVYARAYALDPHLQRPQLASNMLVQRMQVMLLLRDLVQQLDDQPRLTQAVAAHARRHGIYGISDSRVRTARAALAWAIDRILETEQDSAIRIAWSAAFDAVEGLLGGSPRAGR